MTYCLAWKTKHAAFLLADTAVTLNKSLGVRKYSSFGELQGSEGKETVIESLLKINVFGKTCALVFSGDVELANSIIDSLKFYLDSGESPRRAFRAAIRTNSPFSKFKSVSILFTFFDGQVPVLLKFDSTNPTAFIDDLDIVQIGSMGSYYPAFSDYIIRSFIDGSSKPGNILAAITAVLQSYGIHSVLAKMYVGGAFFGLYLDQSGVYWQEDTTYVIYHENDQRLQLAGLITVGIRDNVLFVGSSLINETKFMSNRLSAAAIESWMNSTSQQVLKTLDNYQSQYYVFLSNKQHMVTVVRTYGNLTNEYFQIYPLGNNKVAFLLNERFYQLIRDIHAQRSDNAIPFRLTWLHATNA